MLITEEVHSSHSIYKLHVNVFLNEHHVVNLTVCLRSTQNSKGSTADKQCVLACVGVNSHSAKCTGSHVISVAETKS